MLYFGDCLDFMRGMVERGEKVNAIITDPPYLTTDLALDKKGFNTQEVFSLAKDVLKPNGYFISFGSLELHSIILQSGFLLRFSGVWIKTNSVMRTHNAKKPMSEQEIWGVYVLPKHKISELTFNRVSEYGHKAYKKIQKRTQLKRNGEDSLSRINLNAFLDEGETYLSENGGFRYVTDVILAPNKQCMNHQERTDHPTQKPIELLRKIIAMLTNPNDTIFDPFMGSGSTGVASLIEGRKFIGCEIDAEYFEIAKRRVEETDKALRQSLFYGID